MKRWITKYEILDLIKGKEFKSEEEFQSYVAPRLINLFKVKDDQVATERGTTSFDGTLSNRADIVIATDDNFHKVLVVIELKLAKNIEKFNSGVYEGPLKQLHKYCQDTRAPFGVLLTEDACFIYKNKYFSYDQVPKREQTDRLPCIEKIEDIVAFYALVDFLLYKKSIKYVSWMIFILFNYLVIMKMIENTYGLGISMISSLVIGVVAGAVLAIFALIYKIFD